MKFNEDRLEQAVLELFEAEGYRHLSGDTIHKDLSEALLKDDLKAYLLNRYSGDHITLNEIESIIRKLELLPASALYHSNKSIIRLLTDGFVLKREDPSQKDLFIHLLDFTPGAEHNIFKIVNQLEIQGYEKRIPDAIVYVNGLPLVVIEFKSAIKENTTIHDAYTQLTVRYRRDIPELFKYNAFCVISDGVNNKAGSLFAPYDFFYAWRKTDGRELTEAEGIDSLYTLVKGMFQPARLLDIVRNFIFFPDTAKQDVKILCRYPQYYGARKLFQSVRYNLRPQGSGKGGTYFGATGCGKSYTMLFLTRLLMKDPSFSSPTIVLITDRTDLDDQLSGQFINAKHFIGDHTVISVESREHLRELLRGRNSGGVFLTTIQKFTEDTELLTDRANVICISDEAHRSQVNLEQKVKITANGVKRTYGFARYLRESLPNATYVGFTGTPIDATLDVFGEVVDAYTMKESVEDEITVRIVYEGRAAKVTLNEQKLQEIEAYYAQCAEEGSNDYQIEESKCALTNMEVILGDPDRLKAVARDVVHHYEQRLAEGASVLGKAMFVCASRRIAYDLYKEIIALRPQWAEIREGGETAEFPSGDESSAEFPSWEGQGVGKRRPWQHETPEPTTNPSQEGNFARGEVKPMERIKMVMTRNKDDEKKLYDLLGTREYRKELDRQFKNPKSNFKIAIVVDMWLTGFDVPFLDTIYIDKPVSRHSLIQTISRVNRVYEGKEAGLVVDYIGIKRNMNLALKQYSKVKEDDFEEIAQAVIIVKDQLDLLRKLFYGFGRSGVPVHSFFDFDPASFRSAFAEAMAAYPINGVNERIRVEYFHGTPLQQLHCLNAAVEYVQRSEERETLFMGLVKRLRSAFKLCLSSDEISEPERDEIHFYFAVSAIVYKLNKGDAPDAAQMNDRVRELVKEALISDGVEEVFKLGKRDAEMNVDIFSDEYMAKIDAIELPNTKIKLLQQLLKQAILEFKKVNKIKGIDFSEKFRKLVKQYNERHDDVAFANDVLDDLVEQFADLFRDLQQERDSFMQMGIDFEEKAFYDILKAVAEKYDFEYPHEKLIPLSQAVKKIVDDKARYTDWSRREDIKAELKVDLILTLAEHRYPPVPKDEVFKEIFEQAENFKKYRDE